MPARPHKLSDFPARSTLTAGLALLALSALSGPALAADTLRQVTLHPKGATVERSLTLTRDAREARFSCLSPLLVADSLQLTPAPGMNVGEMRLTEVSAELLPECEGANPVRELTKQSQQLKAEREALEVSLAYLKQVRGRDLPPGTRLADATETIRRQTLDLLQRQQALKDRHDRLEHELALAKAQEGPDQEDRVFHVLTVPIDSAQGGELRLGYRVDAAGWTPLYRARLDTATGRISLERRAEITQRTGEDWRQAPVRLSTELGRLQGSVGHLAPWLLDIRPKEEPRSRLAAAPAPAAPGSDVLERVQVTGTRIPSPFTPEAFVGEFATEYALPGRQRLVSHAPAVQVSLSRETVDAELHTRVQPRVDASAFLVAQLARPAGSWPRGKLQLYRDGQMVGETQLQFSGERKTEWAFGRDERVRVRALPERLEGMNAGLVSQRRERLVEHVYELENRQDKPLSVVMLEASPVSQHADVRIEMTFSPEPQPGDWQEQPGIRAWRVTLAPQQTQRFSARYKLSAPADAQVTGWR